jgi:hypothetical protein
LTFSRCERDYREAAAGRPRDHGQGEKLLSIFLDDRRALPDALLLRAVDIILADRHSRLGSPPRSSLALEGLPNER